MSDRTSRLSNEDLAPVSPSSQTWGRWDFAALWVGMAVCIPTYMLAASLMQGGMFWWQALLTISLGNLIILIPMLLNAHAGTKYGIPFPVFLRSSFGILGSNIPAMMRAIVACGWFGIQTWLGGAAIYSLAAIIFGFTPHSPQNGSISLGQFACFLLFWAINIAIILRGIESIRWLEAWSAPILLLMGLGLLAWAVTSAGGFSAIFAESTVNQVRGKPENFNFWKVFFPSLTAMVGFWATLALNIPDFTRYARSQKEQMAGQAIGLPTTMTLFSFIGIAVTAATVVVFGKAIWNPVELLSKFSSPVVVGLSLFGLSVATLSTNIAANVVSPANDFSNLAPHKISFKMGGLITGVLGIAIMPWRLLNDLGAYIFTWLIGYSAMLGAIGGVMIVDYFFIKKTVIHVDALYQMDGEYSFGGSGFHWRALVALFVGIAPNLPGFLHAASNGDISVPSFFQALYPYAWFVGIFTSGLCYALLHLLAPLRRSSS